MIFVFVLNSIVHASTADDSRPKKKCTFYFVRCAFGIFSFRLRFKSHYFARINRSAHSSQKCNHSIHAEDNNWPLHGQNEIIENLENVMFTSFGAFLQSPHIIQSFLLLTEFDWRTRIVIQPNIKQTIY